MPVINANSVDPDQIPRSASSDFGLHCLPKSHLWDARHKWVKTNYSRLSLSRTPRDSMKHFEITVLRHIRFAEQRKKTINRTTTFNRMNM